MCRSLMRSVVFRSSPGLVVQPAFVIERDGYLDCRLVGGSGWSGHALGVVGVIIAPPEACKPVITVWGVPSEASKDAVAAY
jgi:hypothetical protein